MNIQVVPARPEHIPHLAATMREADRREVWASHRHTPEEALRASLQRSELAWTALLDGEPVLMWGVTPATSIIGKTGVPWLLASDGMFRIWRKVARHSREFVARMQERYPRLQNRVHALNHISLCWLSWCGFVIEPEPEEINGEEFYTFWRQ